MGPVLGDNTRCLPSIPCLMHQRTFRNGMPLFACLVFPGWPAGVFLDLLLGSPVFFDPARGRTPEKSKRTAGGERVTVEGFLHQSQLLRLRNMELGGQVFPYWADGRLPQICFTKPLTDGRDCARFGSFVSLMLWIPTSHVILSLGISGNRQVQVTSQSSTGGSSFGASLARCAQRDSGH